jgi:uncharacterized protein YcfJ
MKKLILSLCLQVAPVLSLTACATYRPILDENEKFIQVGETQAERDIDECMTRADAYLEKHKSERMKKEAGRGAASGAIMGGILGVVTGGGLRSAAVGAGVGAAVGAGGGAAGVAAEDNLSPDRIKQNYVTKCLNKQQYDVIGWK